MSDDAHATKLPIRGGFNVHRAATVMAVTKPDGVRAESIGASR